MLKTLKRKIALVAVAAVGVGMLSAIPASAVASLIGFNASGATTDAGAPIIQRTDTNAPANMVIDVNATGVITASGVISWTLSRNGGTAGTALPGGMSIAWFDAKTDATAAGADAPAANAASAFAKVGNNADNDLLFTVTVAKTTAPGKYVLSVKAPAAGDAVTLTFYVSGAPTAMAWSATSYTVDQNANNAGASTLAITDVAGNPTYLLAGEAIDIAVTAVSGATLPTSSVTLVDTGNSVLSATTVATTLAAAVGATAGTYSLVASRSAGLVGLANATTSIVVGATPIVATQIALKTTTFTNSDTGSDATGSDNGDATFDATGDSINSTDAINDVVFVSTNSPSLTFVASTANDLTTGSTRFSVAANGGNTLPNGVVAVTAANVAVVDTTGAANASTSEYTVTSTSPVAGSSYLVKAVSTAATKGFAVTYQNPVPNSITRTTPASSPILTKIAGTSTATATVKDQFGVAIPNVYVTVGITGRNPQSKTVLSDAAGLVSMSWTDTYVTSTTNTATADTLTFTIVGTGGANGMPAAVNTATLTINYTASVDVATLTMTAASNPAGADVLYDTAAVDVTQAVTINPSTAIAAFGDMTDQIRVLAVAKNAAAAVMEGVPVVFTATDGAFFATSANTTATKVPVAGTTAVKTVTVYTNAQGEAFAQARFTKTGAGVVTATVGTATGKFSVTVATAKTLAHSIAITPTATAAADGAATLTATVKDPFGNVASGVAVSFVGTGVIFLNGLNAVSGTTDTNGQIVVQSLSGNKVAGTATVKATVTEGGTLIGTLATSILVTTTTLALTAGVSDATSTLTYTAATAGGASTEIAGVKTDVATANAAVKTLATQVTVLQASVATLIDSLTTQIAALLQSVSDLTKAVAKMQADAAKAAAKAAAKKK